MPHTQNKTDKDKHTPPTRVAVLAIIFLMLAALLTLFFVARANIRNQAKHQKITSLQKEQRAYRIVLSEMHTGIRLARWEDFLQQFPSSKNARAVRVQHAVLQAYETSAWAKYSDTLYTLPANAQKKSAAYEAYIANWGTLIRTKQLENLSVDTYIKSTKSVSFKTEKSIYQAEKNTVSLAGEPHNKATSSRKLQRKAFKKHDLKNKMANRDVRVKTARSPVYPRKAKRRGINAKVLLSLNIDAKGRVTHVKLVSVEATRYQREFVRAARRAARRSRFHPEIRGHKPVKHDNYLRTYIFAAQK